MHILVLKKNDNFIEDLISERRKMKMRKRLTVLAMALGLVAGFLGSAVGGDKATVGVSATILPSCKFTSGAAVSFTFDPSSASDATGTVSQATFRLSAGALCVVSVDNGLNERAGIRRMINAAGDYIPYALAYARTRIERSDGARETMDVAGVVLNSDFVDAPPGDYGDTVTLAIEF